MKSEKQSDTNPLPKDYECNVIGTPDGADKVIALDKEGNQLNDIEDGSIEGFCFIKKLRDESPEYDRKLWNELIRIGRNLEPRIEGETFGQNNLSKPFIETILDTLKYYGAEENQLRQTLQDLAIARYRLWDWLGMCYTGALWAKGRTFTCIENMVKLYICQEDVGGFVWWLRGHDLDVEEPHRCGDCINSYRNWMKDVKQKGLNPNDFR